MSLPSYPDPSARPGDRVLVVDDNQQGRVALARFLELRGYAVRAVSSGAEALVELQGPAPPGTIVTDLDLPDLDGREIARIARTLVPRPRVVLITGWTVEARPEDLAADGIDRLLPKPLDLRELSDQLLAWRGGEMPARGGA